MQHEAQKGACALDEHVAGSNTKIFIKVTFAIPSMIFNILHEHNENTLTLCANKFPIFTFENFKTAFNNSCIY